MSLVEFIPGKDGLPDTLEEVARHMQALWATAVVHIEGESYLESDHHGNLVVRISSLIAKLGRTNAFPGPPP